MTSEAKVLPLNAFEVHEFSWGAAVRDWRRQKWVKAILSDGQEIDTERIPVELHENGIEFLTPVVERGPRR